MKTNNASASFTSSASFKNMLFLLITLAFLLGLRMIWLSAISEGEHPQIKAGILDLRGTSFDTKKTFNLDGDWIFHPNTLISTIEEADRSQSTTIPVPHNWKDYLSDQSQSSKGYGTYQLKILVDDFYNDYYVLWVQRINNASAIYINGELVASTGAVAANEKDYSPKVISYTAPYYKNEQKELNIFIQVSNYENSKTGGIVKSIRFGLQAAMDYERLYSIGFQLATFIILILHAFYASILILFKSFRKDILYFLLLTLLASLTVISDHDQLLAIWLPINFTWTLIIRILSYLWVSFVLLLLARTLTNHTKRSLLFRLYFVLCVLYSLVSIIFPSNMILTNYKYIFSVLYCAPLPAVAYLFSNFAKNNRHGAMFLLLAACSVLSSILWGIFLKSTIWVYYPFEIIFAIIGFSAYWFKQYLRNSSENALLNDKLKKSDKLKDQFLANTSHELRTPLHGMINIAHTLLTKEKHMISATSYKDMELLVKIGRRMSYLVDDLIDMNQLQENRLRLQKEEVQLQAVVPGVIHMLHFLTTGKQLQIKMDISTVLPTVYADEKRIVQVLYNLIHNAIKYTEQGTITVYAEVTNKEVVVSVSDTGPGMDEATVERIFSPYEQGVTEVSKGGGIGLGLSICKQLIELHDSRILVKTKPGTGSTFSFSLPQAQYVSDIKSMAASSGSIAPDWLEQTKSALHGSVDTWIAPETALPSVAHGHINILIVDDDPINLKVLVDLLGTENYNVTSASSAQEALKLIVVGQWDLIILDVMMPYMSGYELTRKIREQITIAELPILLLTARNKPEDIYAGFVAGANDYITKPVDAIELKYRVWSLTTLKQSVDEKLRMEAAYLQAQIHPHFLFNTLNSIMALSTINTEKMHQLCDAFTSYLRISFDFLNAGEVVSLARELKLVRAYLYIEKERFNNRIQVKWAVNSNVELMIPPLTIQPIVENAVRHGLLSSLKGGTIHIAITPASSGTMFKISDNGAGMEPDKINRLLDPAMIGKGGIGLFNTNRRLVKRYGAGLTIQSKINEGTSVSFFIPHSTP
ncbi:ATP-binding protein [Paenibacillus sp. IITD108]|uniref:ATP-binding protein n=1 Tax=Paenibacillus sp. IITD108 TaxID=3116649 RepID=UPI002F3F5F83